MRFDQYLLGNIISPFSFLDDFSTIESVLSKLFDGQGDASFKNALDLSISLFGYCFYNLYLF